MPSVSENLRANDLYVALSRKHPGKRAVYRDNPEGPHECVADDFDDAAAANRWIAFQKKAGTNG